MSTPASSQSTQKGAGSLSLNELLLTAHDNPVGADLHPLVLEAVVQVAFERIKAESQDAANTQASHRPYNPYRHLTQAPFQLTSPQTRKIFDLLHHADYIDFATLFSAVRNFLADTYDSFWSQFDKKTPVRYPACSTGIPLPGHLTRSKKRDARSLEELMTIYPAFADYIRVIEPPRGSVLQSFPCNQCDSFVSGDKSAVRLHLRDMHHINDPKSVQKCVYPGCAKMVTINRMDDHVMSHQVQIRPKCGLCGEDFVSVQMTKEHLETEICPILQMAKNHIVAGNGETKHRKRMK